MNDLTHRSRSRCFAARRGITLAEVLIAMGILAIGLLGVAAVFPVGGHYMQAGDIADRGGAIAQAALEDAIIRGHLDPENWVTTQFDIVLGVQSDPARPLAEGLREALAVPDSSMPPLFGSSREHYLGGTYGGAYVIDPIGFSAAMDESRTAGTDFEWSNAATGGPVMHFPAVGFPSTFNYDFGNASLAPIQTPTWRPWSGGGRFWPVRRVITTTDPPQGAGVVVGRSSMAAELFTTSDDLALSFPSNGDNPARQSFEAWNNTQTPVQGLSSKRQARGDYSWLLTVAPPSDAARNALATTPDAYPMDVSAVVFHKRVVGRGATAARENERLVTAKVVSTSPGGGELLLQRRPDANDPVTTSPFEGLRGGHYVMVVGPHPQSTSARPRLALRWCRVLNIEDSGQQLTNGPAIPLGEDAVRVALRGPDWPWQEATNLNVNSISNDLRVAIVPGVVAVHTKTMRLGRDQGLEWTSN